MTTGFSLQLASNRIDSSTYSDVILTIHKRQALSQSSHSVTLLQIQIPNFPPTFRRTLSENNQQSSQSSCMQQQILN